MTNNGFGTNKLKAQNKGHTQPNCAWELNPAPLTRETDVLSLDHRVYWMYRLLSINLTVLTLCMKTNNQRRNL